MNVYCLYENDTIISFLSERPDSGDFIEIDNSLLVNGYNVSHYNIVAGKIEPKTDKEVEQILVAEQQQLQQLEQDSIGFDVVMQHMVKEKKAELQWDASKQYHTDDVVYHNGRMWKATSNNTNNEPDDVPGDWSETD